MNTACQFTVLDESELEVTGGVAPLVVWGVVVGSVVALATIGDAVNAAYDLYQGWSNYEPQPHVTSTITYPAA
jgi:lactobin A/cerein 7B family class IIb bacteriocin